jgi:hypothetical protein
MWYLYKIEFYSSSKENKILSFAGKYMELENIIISDISQFQKAKSHRFSLVCEIYTESKYSNLMKNRSHKWEITYERGVEKRQLWILW